MSQPTTQPTYVRHASRHLHRTLSDHVAACLGELDWTGPNPPFGTTPVTLLARRMRESDMQSVAGNMVAVSFGEEPDDAEQELGAGFLMSNTQMVLDVIAVSDPVGLALASDLKDWLGARMPGRTRFLTLRDYTTSSTGVDQPDYKIEIANVHRARPDNAEIKMFWQVLIVDIEMTFPGALT